MRGECAFQFDAFQVENPQAFQGCPQIYDSSPWSMPSWRRIAAGAAVALAASGCFFTPAPAEAITVDKWHRPLSEPVRTKPPLPVGAQQTLAFYPNPITKIDWFEPLSEPSVKIKKPVAQQQFRAWGAFTPEVVTVDKWFKELETPVRLKIGLSAAAQQFYTTDTEPTVSFSWYNWLTEPVRLKPGLGAWQQQFFTIDTEPVVSFGWFNWLSEPSVKSKKSVAQQQEYASPVFVSETITVDKWFRWLEEPVRLKRGLSAALQQFYTTDTEPTVSFSWFNGLAEPSVRVKSGLSTANQPFIAYPYFAEVIFPDKWYAPWRDPVRIKLGLATNGQQFLAHIPFVEDTTYESKWHQPWSEPSVKTKKPVVWQQVVADVSFVERTDNFESKWHYPWSEPVRVKLGLHPSAQQFIAYPQFQEFITLDKWYASWREPVRVKLGLATSNQPFTTVQPLKPVITIGWYQPFTDPPVRKKIIAALQPTTAHLLRPPLISIGWYRPLEEPPYRKKVIAAHQPWTTVQPLSPRVSFGWYEPLGEPPYRLKVLASHQPVLAIPVFTPVTAITLTLNAIEIGDVFTGNLNIVYCFHSLVSIVEIEPKEANLAAVSPVAVTSSANVAITEIALPRQANLATTIPASTYANVNISEIPASSVITRVTVIETC